MFDFVDQSTGEYTVNYQSSLVAESSVFVHQVCCGVWRWRVHHLHCHGFEEQELRLGTGVRLGT